MKKTILYFFLLFAIGLQAQNFWTEVGNIFPDPSYYAGEISIVDANIVWINGRGSLNGLPNNNYLWAKSEDGGLTWTSGSYNMPNSSVGSMKAISASVAYVSTYSANGIDGVNGVWITTDSGATWTQQVTASFNSPYSFVDSIYFWNENDGVVIGDPVNNSFEIYTTSNGGTNWIPVPTSNIPVANSNEYIYVLNYDAKGNSFWCGTNYGRILHSSNRGLSWTVLQSPLTDFGGSNTKGNFTFKNENEGILTNSDFQQWRTLDSGNTWTPEFPAGVNRNFHTEYVNQTNNTYFQFGEDINNSMRGSSYSIDGGLNWIDLNTDSDPVSPFSVKFQSGSVGFCIGYYINNPYENGVFQTKFFRLTDPLFRLNSAPLAVSDFDCTTTSLAPNPTSSWVKIVGNSITKISISDVLGKAISTQNYNSLQEVSVNMASYQNGIYLLKITNADGNSTIKKIIKN
jgi:photosystem II stability/assembly factor-like uncharacterized protein